MKECYNILYLPRPFREFLEQSTSGKLTKIRLLFPNEECPLENPPFWRFRLEGIRDLNLGYRRISTRFREIGPTIQAAYPTTLIRICKEVGWQDLVLDFSEEEALFKGFSEEGFNRSVGMSPEELYPFRKNQEILEILPPKKVLRRIRQRGTPNL